MNKITPKIPEGYKKLRAGTVLKAGDKFNYKHPVSEKFNYWDNITNIGYVLTMGNDSDNRDDSWNMNGWIVIRPI